MGTVSATSTVTTLDNWKKDYGETLREAKNSMEIARNQEKFIDDLMRENKLLHEINDRVQGNFDDLVWEHSNLSMEHQAAMTQLGESHASFRLDLADRLHFSNQHLSSESFLSEEKNLCFDFSSLLEEKNIYPTKLT
jgi:hypothetical protein